MGKQLRKYYLEKDGGDGGQDNLEVRGHDMALAE